MQNSKFGMILIAIGLFVLLGNFGLMEGSFFLLAVGAIFLALYMRSEKENKPYGLLVPGNILIGLAVFSGLEPFLGPFDGPLFFLTMGLSFFGIHWIHQRNGGEFKETKWAITVGLGAAAFAAFVFIVDLPRFPMFNFISSYFWPILLIGGGVYMIFGKGKGKAKSSDF